MGVNIKDKLKVLLGSLLEFSDGILSIRDTSVIDESSMGIYGMMLGDMEYSVSVQASYSIYSDDIVERVLIGLDNKVYYLHLSGGVLIIDCIFRVYGVDLCGYRDYLDYKYLGENNTVVVGLMDKIIGSGDINYVGGFKVTNYEDSGITRVSFKIEGCGIGASKESCVYTYDEVGVDIGLRGNEIIYIDKTTTNSIKIGEVYKHMRLGVENFLGMRVGDKV